MSANTLKSPVLEFPVNGVVPSGDTEPWDFDQEEDEPEEPNLFRAMMEMVEVRRAILTLKEDDHVIVREPDAVEFDQETECPQCGDTLDRAGNCPHCPYDHAIRLGVVAAEDDFRIELALGHNKVNARRSDDWNN